ncbi:hypothetical protein UlMin_037373 [Ulmus minor]
MARGGGSNNNNNDGHCPNNRGSNRFANLDQSASDDSNSPYYLSNGDHRGLALVSQPLIGNNYNSWSRAMTMSLIAKSKLCFVDGSLSRPAIDDECYNSWFRCNSMVMSWILHAISHEIADSVMYIDNAEDMWTDLYDRFHQNNGPRVFQIKQVCLQFLMGLNEFYAQIRAQILMQDPFPPITKVFSLVVQEERQRGLTSSSFSESASFAVHTGKSAHFKGKYDNRQTDKPTCYHCGYIGHTIDKCYKLYGYPPGLRFKNGTTPSNTNRFSPSSSSTTSATPMTN